MVIKGSVVKNVEFKIESRGHKIIVDQTKEDGGSDAGMTPLELLGASLISCILFYIVGYCYRHKIPTSDLNVELDQTMVENPHRVGEFKIKIHIPQPLNDRDSKTILKIAQSCTVHNTLSHKPKISISLN